MLAMARLAIAVTYAWMEFLFQDGFSIHGSQTLTLHKHPSQGPHCPLKVSPLWGWLGSSRSPSSCFRNLLSSRHSSRSSAPSSIAPQGIMRLFSIPGKFSIISEDYFFLFKANPPGILPSRIGLEAVSIIVRRQPFWPWPVGPWPIQLQSNQPSASWSWPAQCWPGFPPLGQSRLTRPLPIDPGKWPVPAKKAGLIHKWMNERPCPIQDGPIWDRIFAIQRL